MLWRLKRINNIVGIDLETPTIIIVRKAIKELNILKKGINRKIRKRLRIEAEAEDVKDEVEARETLEVTNY
jgi:predicted metal-dependent RNase